MDKKSKDYLPDVRSNYSPNPEMLISKSIDGFDTIIPNPVTDDVVVNNISTAEFDYTNALFDDDDI